MPQRSQCRYSIAYSACDEFLKKPLHTDVWLWDVVCRFIDHYAGIIWRSHNVTYSDIKGRLEMAYHTETAFPLVATVRLSYVTRYWTPDGLTRRTGSCSSSIILTNLLLSACYYCMLAWTVMRARNTAATGLHPSSSNSVQSLNTFDCMSCRNTHFSRTWCVLRVH